MHYLPPIEHEDGRTEPVVPRTAGSWRADDEHRLWPVDKQTADAAGLQFGVTDTATGAAA